MTVEQELAEARVRIASLEAELLCRPVRKSRSVVTPECQYCGDTSKPKHGTLFLGLPFCEEWRGCASRIRRAAKGGVVLDPRRLRGGLSYRDWLGANPGAVAVHGAPLSVWCAGSGGPVFGRVAA